MKIEKQFIVLGLVFLLALYACGGASVPPGANKIGHYEGSFTSAPLSGSCQFDLYRLPDGSGTFEGAFQGLEEAGLEMLAEARQLTGLPVVTEVMSPEQIPLISRYADVLQVGARNMQNYALLHAVGESQHPV